MTEKNLEGASAHVEEAGKDAVEQGRLIQDEERQLSVWKTIRLHPMAILACSAAFTAGLNYGYDSISNGSTIAMPSFIIYFGSNGSLSAIWTSLWVSMTSLFQAVGAVAGGLVCDRIGRKWPGVIAGLISLVGTSVLYIAKTREVLLVGKMICGLAIGISVAVGTTYASEVAPFRLRNSIQASFVLFVVLMQGLGLGIVRIFVPYIDQQAFRNVFAIQWGPGALMQIAFLLAPDSKSSIDDRLAYLEKIIAEEQAQQSISAGSYFDCFKGHDLQRTAIVIFVYSSVNLGGAAFLSQSIYFLLTLGLPAVHIFDISIGGFALGAIIIILSRQIGKLFSQQRILLAGCCLNFAFLLVIGCLYYAPGQGAIWAIAVLMNFLISLQTSFIQASGWPIAAEISSYRLRAKTLSIGVVSQTLSAWVTQFVVPYMYNVDSGDLGGRTAFPFAGISFLMILVVFFYVPDTTGLSTEEIDQRYEDKVHARQFKSYM